MSRPSRQRHAALSRDELVHGLVNAQSTLVLSTTGADGHSCAAPLFYLAGPDLELYWFSAPSSLHSANICRDPRASVSIFHPTVSWSEIRGVQMRGIVERATGKELRRKVSQEYRERFHLPAMFRLAMARTSLYIFRPSWIRYLDNGQGFGFKFEVTR